MTSLTAQNVQEHCRTCLIHLNISSETDKMPAYVNVTKCENVLKLMRILIESNANDIENYPQNICLICFRVFEEIYEFRRNVLECTATLNSVLDAKKLSGDDTSTKSLSQEEQAVEELIENVETEDMETEKVLKIKPSLTTEINQIDFIAIQNTAEENSSNEHDPKDAANTKQAFHLFDESPILEHSYQNDTATGSSIKSVQVDKKYVSKEQKDNKSTTFRCDQCESSFVQLSKYISHVHEEHPTCKRRYGCDNCDKTYKHIASLRNHLHIAHNSKVQPIKCIDCGKLYKTPATLKQHRLNYHFSEEKIKKSKDFDCEQCDASFVRAKSLASHYIAKHSTDTVKAPLEFKCTKCTKHFQNKFNLENHTLRYHLDVKNFICNICGTRYAKKFMLTTHMRIHCTDTEKFMCDQCGRRFAQKCDVNEHIRAIHFKTKPFKCLLCDQSFATAKTLRHHVYRHTGEKPYACDICFKSFRQPTTMKLHRNRHNLSSDDKY